jgi:putative hemolysin
VVRKGRPAQVAGRAGSPFEACPPGAWHLGHGDLQHGNVILVPGRDAGSLAVKLIDYDGMFVPALAGSPSGEVGHPAYQHPQRLREGTYGPEVDRFPLLVIYVAIRALVVGGRALWDRYDNGDNLLFREQDLRSPRESSLFWDLVRLNDPEVRRLADRLSRAAYRPLDETPLLEELLSPAVPAVVATRPDAPAAAVPAAYPLAIPVTEPATPAPRVADAGKPVRGRGLLMAALVGGAVVSGLCCLGLGSLILVGALRGPATSPGAAAQPKPNSGPVAQGRTNPEPVLLPKATEQGTQRPEPVLLPKASEKGTPPHGGTLIDCVTLRGHTDVVSSVCFSPDGKRLASASRDQTVKVWDARTGQEQLTLQGHTAPVLGVCFSPDGQRLASASEDKTVKVWDAALGKEVLTLKGHRGGVPGICFSPDGRRLASASWDRTVKVWDAQTGQELLTLKGHTAAIYSVSFNPDGSRLASASYDRTVKVWDAETGQEERTLQGHTDVVSSVCFSPDGKRLASASMDKTVKVWDALTGQDLLTFHGHTSGVRSVCFSPDGRRLASAGDTDPKVKVWGLEGVGLGR